MPDTFPVLNDDQILALLRERYPRGMHMDQNGMLREAGAARKITDLAALGENARAPKTFQFEFRGEMIEFTLRGLVETENSEADKLDAGILPPRKSRVEAGRKIFEQDYDFMDRDYIAKKFAAERLKKAFVLSKGLVGLEIPGGNLDEKAQWLGDQFPPQLTDSIYSAVLSLTSAVPEKASFI